MHSNLRVFSWILPFMLVLSSCNDIENIEIIGVEKVIFEGIQDNMVYFSAGLKVYNPSAVSFKIREVNLKTVADGVFLGTLNCTDKIKINARSDSVYMVPLSLKLANIFTGASMLYKLSRQKKVNMEVKGYVRVRTMMIYKKIEVSEKQLMDVPKIR